MTTLIFTDIEFKENSMDDPVATATDVVTQFIEENKSIIDKGVNLRLSLLHKGAPIRSGKKANEEALRRLVTRPHAKVYWEDMDGIYVFDFFNGTFTRNKKSIHLTAQEQLVLYQKLLMDAQLIPHYAQIIHGMRYRYGSDFLKGIL